LDNFFEFERENAVSAISCKKNRFSAVFRSSSEFLAAGSDLEIQILAVLSVLKCRWTEMTGFA
jgi:hypothetical protein